VARARPLLLFGRHLTHVDPDADHLARLHAHRASGVLARPGPPANAAVGDGGDGRVLDALTPGPGLPVVDGAGVLVAAPHLLQGAAVGARDAPWGPQGVNGKRKNRSEGSDGGILTDEIDGQPEPKTYKNKNLHNIGGHIHYTLRRENRLHHKTS